MSAASNETDATPRFAIDHPDLRTLAGEIAALKGPDRLEEFALVNLDDAGAETGWRRPVPGMGDPNARLMIIATCPQADGAYETGIPYQNEFAGRWIYSALKVLGCFDSAATDVGMATKLNDVYLTYGVKQPVPKDRPQASENDLYLPFLHRELQVLSNLKCILAFGRMTHTLIQKGLAECDLFDTSGVDFPDYEHGVIHTLGEGLPRIANYHKLSPRNESTQAVSRGGFTRLVMNCLAAS